MIRIKSVRKVKIERLMLEKLEDLDAENDPDKVVKLQGVYDGYQNMLKKEAWVSPEVILTVAANLIGVVLVLNRERFDIVRSAALPLIGKITTFKSR